MKLKVTKTVVSMLLIMTMVITLIPQSALAAESDGEDIITSSSEDTVSSSSEDTISSSSEDTVSSLSDIFTQSGVETSTFPEGQGERSETTPLGKYAQFRRVSELVVNAGSANQPSEWTMYLHDSPIGQKPNYYNTNKITGTLQQTNILASRMVAVDWYGVGQAKETAMISISDAGLYYQYNITVFNQENTVLFEKINVDQILKSFITGNDSIYKRSPIPSVLDNLIDIVAGDFDGDSMEDIAVAYLRENQYNTTISIAIVGESVSLSSKSVSVNYGKPAAYFSLAAGDLNTDGIDDIALSTSAIRNVDADKNNFLIQRSRLYEFYGCNIYSSFDEILTSQKEPLTLATNIVSCGIDIADADGDGKKELIIGAILCESFSSSYYDAYSYSEVDASTGEVRLRNVRDYIATYKYSDTEQRLKPQYASTFNSVYNALYSKDIYSAVDVTTVAFNGNAMAPYVFRDNYLYRFTGKGWTRELSLRDFDGLGFTGVSGWGADGEDLDGDGLEDLIYKTQIAKDSGSTSAKVALVIYYAKDFHALNKTTKNPAPTIFETSSFKSNLSFSLPDTDTDSVIGTFEGYQFAYTDPIIVSVMASAPHFEDAVLNSANNSSATSFSTQRSSGSGSTTFSTVSTGGYFAFEQEFSVFGVTAAKIELEMTIGSQVSSSTEKTVTRSESTTYSSSAGTDSVVLSTVPMDIFYYKVESPIDPTCKSSEMEVNRLSICIPYDPIIEVVSMEKYNEIRSSNPDLPDLKRNVILHTPGDATTYPKSESQSDLVRGSYSQNIVKGSIWAASEFRSAGYSDATISQTLSMEETTETQNSTSTEFSFKGGGGAGGVTVGAYVDTNSGSGTLKISTKGFEYSGTVQGMRPDAQSQGYKYNWKLVHFMYDAGTAANPYRFPVITYVVKDAQRPPILPRREDIKIKNRTTNSITLAWPKSQEEKDGNSNTTYGVYFYSQSGGNYAFLGNAVWDEQAQEYTYTQSDLNQATNYSFALQASRATFPMVSFFSPIINVQTPTEGIGNVSFSNLSDIEVTRSTGAVTFTPIITESITPDLKRYQWQKLVDDVFVDVKNGGAISGAMSKDLRVDDPFNNWGFYRLIYTQIDSDATDWNAYSPIVEIKLSNVYVDEVAIDPSEIETLKGKSRQFSVDIKGSEDALKPPQAVIWNVTGGNSGTYITETGLLHVNAGEIPGTILKVTATSVFDKSKSATVDVLVTGIAYVTQTGAGKKDGSTWSNAFEGLSPALNAARQAGSSVSQIWVAAGVYKPSAMLSGGSENRDMTFELVKNVIIYGGFIGTERSLAERNLTQNISILSGDLGVAGDMSDNAYHVVTSLGDMGEAALDGFTITGGNANTDSHIEQSSWPNYSVARNAGGGIAVNGSSLKLVNLIIKNNNAVNGGGAYFFGGSPTLSQSLIVGNTSDYGGGIYLDKEASPSFTNITVSDNNVTGELGGGIYNNNQTEINLMNSIVWGNNANGGSDAQWENMWEQSGIKTEGGPIHSVIQGHSLFRNGAESFDGTDMDFAPRFTNSANGDYTLKAGSLCIDAGNEKFVVETTDIAINPRISGHTVDMGAYEFQTSNELTPLITATALPNGAQGNYYSYDLPMLSNAGFYILVENGKLPDGLSIAQAVNEKGRTGRIYGTPTENGTFEFTLIVEHSSDGLTKYTSKRKMTLTINEPFVGVLDITGVPENVVTRAEYELQAQAIVYPENATHQDIIWSIKDRGTTNANLDGSIVRFESNGIAILTATIIDGSGSFGDYTKDFVIKAMTDGTDIRTEAQLKDALYYASNSTHAGVIDITITSDIIINNPLDLHRTGGDERLVNIKSEGGTFALIRGDGLTGNLLTVTNSTFALENIIIDGNSTGDNSLIYVKYPSKLYLREGAILKNSGNRNNPDLIDEGGAVYLEGELVIDGGEFRNNVAKYGGAIYVFSLGEITMNAGVIKNGLADFGGGVYEESNQSVLVMNGGEISGNIALVDGGAVHGRLEMNGGIIKNNKANNHGGGVLSLGYYAMNTTLTMTGGEISGNTADIGGGVYADGGKLVMSGGIISENESISLLGSEFYSALGFLEMNGGVIFGKSDSTFDTSRVFETRNKEYTYFSFNNSAAPAANDGMIILWNDDRGGAYTPDSSDNLKTYLNTGTVKWTIDGADRGVIYNNGSNTGFIKVSEVIVSGVGLKLEIEDLLDNIKLDDEGEVDLAVDALKEIDMVAIAEAMESDYAVLDKIAELEEAYAGFNNITISVDVEEGVDDSINTSGIEIVGAGLNAKTSGTVIMNIGTPRTIVRIDDSLVSNAIRLNISLTGAGVNQTKLDIPVRVTIPIPENIAPNKFVVLHYHEDGKYSAGDGNFYDIIKPKLNGDSTASFTLARFSEFVFGETTEGEGVNISGQISSYNPKNATTITLYKSGHAGDTVTIEATTGSGKVTSSFTMTDVEPGTYDMIITKDAHLSYTIKGIVVSSTDIDLTAATGKEYATINLLAGDINGDGNINAADVNVIRNVANYNKSADAVGVNNLADVNGDGSINAADVNVVRNVSHYNRSALSHCVFQY